MLTNDFLSYLFYLYNKINMNLTDDPKLNQKINIALIVLIFTLLKNIFVHPTARGRGRRHMLLG